MTYKKGKIHRVIITLLALLLVSSFLKANVHRQSASPEAPIVLLSDSTYRRILLQESDSVTCYLKFPVSKYEVLPDFADNRKELDKLNAFLARTLGDSLLFVKDIQLIGYCSIEGTYEFNTQLARNRVKGFYDYLETYYGLSRKYDITRHSVPEDWGLLRKQVEESDMQYKEEVLRIIDEVDINKGREGLLMKLAGGVPYKYMHKEMFPMQRRVVIKINYDLKKIVEHQLQMKLTDEQCKQEIAQVRDKCPAHVIREPEPYLPRWVVKTNLLQDVTTTLNLGTEFALGRKTTLDLSLSYNPWAFSGARKFKHLMFQPEFRWWQCERFNRGFWGAHLLGGIFNVGGLDWPFPFTERNTKSERFEGWFVGAGIGYGWNYYLSPHWSLELEAGVGYIYSDFTRYRCEKCGEELGKQTKQYFGPTKLAVSLIYLIK